MANEIVVHCKLENKSFQPAVHYFYKAIGSVLKYILSLTIILDLIITKKLKNDSAIKYLEKFIKFKDDNEKKFAKDYEGEIYQAKGND